MGTRVQPPHEFPNRSGSVDRAIEDHHVVAFTDHQDVRRAQMLIQLCLQELGAESLQRLAPCSTRLRNIFRFVHRLRPREAQRPTQHQSPKMPNDVMHVRGRLLQIGRCSQLQCLLIVLYFVERGPNQELRRPLVLEQSQFESKVRSGKARLPVLQFVVKIGNVDVRRMIPNRRLRLLQAPGREYAKPATSKDVRQIVSLRRPVLNDQYILA